MRKVLSVLFVMLLSLGLLFSQGAKDGYGYSEAENTADVSVAALRGPTAMGLVKLMEDAAASSIDGVNYTFRLEGSPDAIVPLLVKGEVDIACIPANLASVIYNNTGKIQILGINTLGVLYIVQYGGEPLNSIEDLKGKVIYSAGKGSTPEYSLEAILSGHGLEVGKDVTIEWKSEHIECVQALLAANGDGNAVAMLPQPFVSTAMMQNPDISIAFDLNKEWEALTSVPLITGVVVATTSFTEEHPDLVDKFLGAYRDSVDYVNSDISGASKLIEDYGIVNREVAERALPYCNIVLIEGDDMVLSLNEYFSTLYELNNMSVGGSIPPDAIYYTP